MDRGVIVTVADAVVTATRLRRISAGAVALVPPPVDTTSMAGTLGVVRATADTMVPPTAEVRALAGMFRRLVAEVRGMADNKGRGTVPTSTYPIQVGYVKGVGG